MTYELMPCGDNEQCPQSKGKKTGAKKTQTFKKIKGVKNPLLTGHTRRVLFVVKEHKKSVDNWVK